MPDTSISKRRVLRAARLTTILAAGAGGALIASPASAQSVCQILPGGIVSCPAPVLPLPDPVIPTTTAVIDLTGSALPILVTLEDGFVSDGPINLGTLAGADIDIVSEGASTINSVGTGLTAISGRNLTAEVTNISSVGDGAIGALLRAADTLIFTSDGLISTVGDNADGVNAEAGTVTLDLGTVTTTGLNAQGVEAVSLNGPTTVTVDLIDTSGDGSIGALITAAGDTSLSGTAIRTGGTDAAAFDISNDAAACVVLGAGGCDNTVTLEEVTTDGFGSIGGIVSAVGDTNVNIGVLRTGGDEAAGLDLSADPAACVLIGIGACDTAFTVNDLATAGERSPGALVRAVGDIDANVGVLRTDGAEAVGLDLASDPTACAVLGAGACDTSFTVGQLTTNGDGATGILVRAAGDTTGNVGVLRTNGDDAAGIDIATDPTACVIAGVGACDVGLAADDIETSGDGAAGVIIANAGAATADIGRIATGGLGSTGLSINQDPAACLALGPGVCRVQAAVDDVETDGDNAPGIDVDSPGPIIVDAGTVTTGGDNSDGVRVTGLDEPVFVNADAVVTTGADSDGVDVTTRNGDQTITVGTVNVSGPGSDGIVATSLCGDIDITARGDVVSAQGSAILASTGCTVAITTLPGASISGATAGIDVIAGGGSTLVIGDSVATTAGPAIDVDGGPAAITVTPTGSIVGRIDLTDSADTLTNNGLLDFAGASDFGAGTDLLVNNGRLRSRGVVGLGGLEQLANNGLIDMVDNAADDQLTIPGDFVAGAGSMLAIDVAAGTAGTPADRLVVGGTVTGKTAVSLNLLGTAPVMNPTGTVIVDAAASAPDSFVLAGPARFGFIDYSLATANGDTRLFALPNERAIEPLILGRAGTDFWYQSADAWSESAAQRRMGLAEGRGLSLWGQAYGSIEERGERQDLDVFGTARTVDLEYETERMGGQIGADFGGGPLVFGVTGGYQRAEHDFASGTVATAEGFNVGGYLLYGGSQGFYGELLAKVDFFDVTLENGDLFGDADIGGTSYGAEGELGYRMSIDRAVIDVNAGLAYVRTDIDGFDIANSRFDFGDNESLRGRLGARISALPGTRHAPFLDVKVLHEFLDGARSTFTNGGFTLVGPDQGAGTWARVEAGVGGTGQGPGIFVSAWGEMGDVRGLGLRAGLRW